MAIVDPERAVVIASQQVQISERDMNLYREHFCKDAPAHEWAIFVQKCALYGLNPMLNEIYLVGRNAKEGDKWVKKFAAQVSITGLISMAERTTKYEGHTTPEYFDEDGNKYEIWSTKHGKHPYAIRIGVYKRGQREAPLITTYFHERAQYSGQGANKQLTKMWETQGIHMLLKCALAAATRWQFSEACSGIYIHEEMQAADTNQPPVTIMPDPSVVESVPAGLLPTARQASSAAPRPQSSRTQATPAPAKPAEQQPANGTQARVDAPPIERIIASATRVLGEGGYASLKGTVIGKHDLGDIADGDIPANIRFEMADMLREEAAKKPSAVGATSGK